MSRWNPDECAAYLAVKNELIEHVKTQKDLPSFARVIKVFNFSTETIDVFDVSDIELITKNGKKLTIRPCWGAKYPFGTGFFYDDAEYVLDGKVIASGTFEFDKFKEHGV